MTQPIDISQPLLSDVLELSWSHEWSGHRGLYIVSTAWTPTYQSWPSYCCLWMSNLWETETDAESPVCHYFWRRPTSHLGTIQSHWVPSKQEEPAIHPLNTYSGSEFAFLVHNAIMQCLIECLIHRHRITQNIAFKEGTHITAKVVWEWTHHHWIHWLCIIPFHPKTAGIRNTGTAF